MKLVSDELPDLSDKYDSIDDDNLKAVDLGEDVTMEPIIELQEEDTTHGKAS